MMGNSSLTTYTQLSPNCNKPRNHVIDTITIHCVVGQVTIERLGEIFAPVTRQASCNYGVDKDGRIGIFVEEKNRSWCTSSSSNDNRAVTIEVASDTTSPYKVNDKAYASLLNLVTDICKRNNINELKWKGDKSLIGQIEKQNMTVHRWFANKSCPGDYLYNLHGAIAAEVNKRLNATSIVKPLAPTPTAPTIATPYTVKITDDSLNIRKGPSTNFDVVDKITNKGTYTIVEEANGQGATKWGKLKSGAGWISLDYCTKVSGTTAGSTTSTTVTSFAVGDTVKFNGGNHYSSSNAATVADSKTTAGKAKITQIIKGAKHPYHLVNVSGGGSNVYGWVDAGTFSK